MKIDTHEHSALERDGVMCRTVETACGPIQGRRIPEPGVTAYAGIRYAHANRWEYPTVITHWSGVYHADTFGACAVQRNAFEAESSSSFYYREFREGLECHYEEDCLFLNIWVPDHAVNAPVIVYLHGGALLGGSSLEKPFINPVWPQKGVLAVTINYRVGVFGFLSLSELAEEEGHTGNYGLYDQLAALQWLHANIAAFGGDPENITLMGQSAGGYCALNLAASPLSQGFVHRVAVSSPSGLRSIWSELHQAEYYEAFWRKVMQRTGVNNIKVFRKLPARAVQKAFDDFIKADFNKSIANVTLVKDDRIIKDSLAEALQRNIQMRVPVMIGSNNGEESADRMEEDIQIFSEKYKAPVYTYYFSHLLPGDMAGAFHSADLWYWFGTLENSWRPFKKEDKILSDRMVAYLTNFSFYGEPNGEKLPFWNMRKAGDCMIFETVEEH